MMTPRAEVFENSEIIVHFRRSCSVSPESVRVSYICACVQPINLKFRF